MNTITFLLAVHNHQPVGNFDHVIEDAYQHAYKPFLEVLERHPWMKVGLHNSGCLVDWLVEHRPEYFEKLEALTRRGQIEHITGGYYEPILPSIPEVDREGQVRKLSTWLEKRFDAVPRGLWLTERVWEPGLVQPLARAGVAYTMVDDSHFLAAGMAADQLWGSYLTEDQGVPLRVYPISKALRYLIPFRPPEETIEFLRRLAQEAPGRVALLGDDGEKFGVWPNTHKLVYEEGWLDRFLTLLGENRDWLEVRFPGEPVASHPPLGKVYLPTASYVEMMEWALPAPAQKRFHDFLHHVEATDGENARFIRGGFWRNFFSRYPESDHINKRMLMQRRVLDALESGGGTSGSLDTARDLLWEAQCNCAYWHGVFGGLYLPHLRNALYEKILSAERLLDGLRHDGPDWVEVSQEDFDCDGDREVFLGNRNLSLVISPAEGGAIQELSYKPMGVALSNGLTRRLEAYHDRVAGAVFAPEHHADDGSGGTASIHDLVLSKEPDLQRLLQFDAYRRSMLQDHFLRADTTIEEFHRGEYGEQGDFLDGAYEVATATRGTTQLLSLRRAGTLWQGGEPHRVSIEKRLRLDPGASGLDIEYVVENLGRHPLELGFGVEWNFGLLAGDSPDHRYRIPGVPDPECALGSRGETPGVESLALFDRHRGFEVRMTFGQPALLWRLPVETVSLSEAGFERIYQSSCVLPIWRFSLEPGKLHRLGMTLEIAEL